MTDVTAPGVDITAARGVNASPCSRPMTKLMVGDMNCMKPM